MSRPVLLGGLFIGVLSSLPIVGAANLCCCLWVVAGGALTAHLQQQRQSEPISSSDAALAALLAGVMGAVINTALSLVLLRLAGGAFEAEVRSAIEQNSQIPFEVRDRVLGILDRANLPLLQAAITLPTYALFGMLGGLLATALFRRKTPPGVAS